jgi:hypothetical protein
MLLGSTGLPVSAIAGAITFHRPIITVIGIAVAACSPNVAVISGVVPGIAGLPPGCRAAMPLRHTLPMSRSHSLSQQRRCLKRPGAQRVPPIKDGQTFKQRSDRCGLILV